MKYHDFTVSTGLNIDLDIVETLVDGITHRRHRIFALGIGPAVGKTNGPTSFSGYRVREIRWQVRFCHRALHLFNESIVFAPNCASMPPNLPQVFCNTSHHVLAARTMTVAD